MRCAEIFILLKDCVLWGILEGSDAFLVVLTQIFKLVYLPHLVVMLLCMGLLFIFYSRL
jgi:hypothetical protein